MSMTKKDFQRLADSFRLSLRAIENMPEGERRDSAMQKHEDIMSGVITACYESNIHFQRQTFEKWVLEYEFIAYLRHEAWSHSFELHRFRSEREALDYLRKQERETGEQYSMSLYGYTTEDWFEAKSFEDVGCPFDYPWMISERGPRGGLKLVNA